MPADDEDTLQQVTAHERKGLVQEVYGRDLPDETHGTLHPTRANRHGKQEEEEEMLATNLDTAMLDGRSLWDWCRQRALLVVEHGILPSRVQANGLVRSP